MRISGVTYTSRKTHKARNTILVIIIILLLSLLTLAILSAYSGLKLLHPEMKEIEAFSSNIVPEYRDISFTGTDKSILLKGWFFQTKNRSKTVILAHSYGKNRLEFGEKTINMIKSFLDEGYNVFTFDFRNSGQSGGKLTTLGYSEKDDLAGAVKYVQQQGSDHIILLGFSTGASACIMAAGENDKVKAVIADSPYDNLEKYLKSSLGKWTGLPAFPFNRTVLYAMEVMSGIDTSDANPEEALKKLSPRRLLLIHGKNNNMVPVENSKSLKSKYSKIAPGMSEIWETDDAGNATGYLKNPEEYMKRVFEFLGKVAE